MASYDVASIICHVPGRGVARSKRRQQKWCRKAADNGRDRSAWQLASAMYADAPYAGEVGRVGGADGVAASAWAMEGHDVPPDVLTDVVHWLRKGGKDPDYICVRFRQRALEGAPYCWNDGCEVVGHLKEFKVCPQCKTARYCVPRVRKSTGASFSS
jgi:TPR repeat protein